MHSANREEPLEQARASQAFPRSGPAPAGIPAAGEVSLTGSGDPGASAGVHPSGLLSKAHTILERPFMLYRPFGVDERGEKIRDISGMIARANVDQLEQWCRNCVVC
jgi:hypothetical protein